MKVTSWIRRCLSRSHKTEQAHTHTFIQTGQAETHIHPMINPHPKQNWLRAAMLGLALMLSTGPARLLADDPKPDPAGTATGVAADVPGFVVTAPADLSADDKKDKDKAKAYDDAKKAFDDYTKQAAVEPLAVKLADGVGHNRVSINFMWTLVTGFLVMFMQAGFALVETGLCRAKPNQSPCSSATLRNSSPAPDRSD